MLMNLQQCWSDADAGWQDSRRCLDARQMAGVTTGPAKTAFSVFPAETVSVVVEEQHCPHPRRHSHCPWRFLGRRPVLSLSRSSRWPLPHQASCSRQATSCTIVVVGSVIFIFSIVVVVHVHPFIRNNASVLEEKAQHVHLQILVAEYALNEALAILPKRFGGLVECKSWRTRRPGEEGQDVGQVGEVELGRHIHEPRDEVGLKPLGENASLDHDRVGRHEPAEATAPAVAVDIEEEFGVLGLGWGLVLCPSDLFAAC